ncbi:glycosyltransferase [Halomonas cerina]|uniref:Glycosyltransferase involved in cell wall biosynthesis n=1 Tax=Halomonas cerina TaxID=447424 RepID=A0A839V257_9GAMM|nr:glycosyltransferase [Halomonas cerina]MBB3189442.1 glycosyltransferase involved in cell wall biosynthesis [Halomonas cerina]
MKVFIVSFSLVEGGAAIAARKFYNILLRGARTEVLRIVADSAADNEESKLGLCYAFHFFKRVFSLGLLKLMADANPVKHSLNIFSSRNLLSYLRSEKQQPNPEAIFNFHWFNNDLLSIFRLSMIPKFSIITLHDEWLFCGAEHYADVENQNPFFRDGYRFFQDGVRGINWNYVIWWLKCRQLNGRNDLIITVPSSWMLERAKSSVVLEGKDIRLLPNPIPTDVFYPALADEKERLRVMFGLSKQDVVICLGAVNGQHNPLKGHDIAEKALLHLKSIAAPELLEKVCLVFFGSGKFDEGVFHGFRMINAGKVSSASDMRNLYAMCDWTLVPSKVEAFGQVAAESLACETPVVAFKSSGLQDVVVDGVSGFLAEPFCYKSYAKCIMNGLLMSHDSREIIGKSGRLHVEEKFSVHVVQARYIAVLKDALVRKRQMIKSDYDV